MIKRRDEAEAQLKDRSAYITKLETKLLHQAMVLRKLRGGGRSSNGNVPFSGKASDPGRSRRESRSDMHRADTSEASAIAAAMRMSRAEDVIDAPGSPHLRHTLSSMMNSPRAASPRAPIASPLKSPPVPETDEDGSPNFDGEDLEGFAAQLEAELDKK